MIVCKGILYVEERMRLIGPSSRVPRITQRGHFSAIKREKSCQLISILSFIYVLIIL
jgi:hypothetical protein